MTEALGAPAQEAKPGTTQATIGKGDTVWGALKDAGFSNQEISKHGLVDKVAQMSNLSDPGKVNQGQQLTLPSRESILGEQGGNQNQPAAAENQPAAAENQPAAAENKPANMSYTDYAALRDSLGSSTLRSGQRNSSSVEALQKTLNERLGTELKVDGDYGPATKAAVEQFQKQNPDLKADGVFGKNTRDALLGPEPEKTPAEIEAEKKRAAETPPASGANETQIRDYIKQAAAAYGADSNVLTEMARRESTFDVGAVNDWDSNARNGTPTEGLFQFRESTFDSFAARAKKANPDAWNGLGAMNWRDWRQQSLTAAWAIENGLGHHWSTYKASGGR